MDPGLELHTVGTRIETEAGEPFVFRGVNVYAVPFYLTDGADVPSLAAVTAETYAERASVFASIRAAGANSVRIPVSAQLFDSTAYGNASEVAYLDRLVAIVDAATAQGLYVDLTWWDPLGEAGAFASEYETEFPMMARVVALFATNSRVLYEPYNEPWDISWPQWLSIMETTLHFWRVSLTYRGLLIVDTNGYSWELNASYMSELTLYADTLPGGADLAFANHRYPNGDPCFCGSVLQDFASQFSYFYKTYPVVGTEYGIYDGYGPTGLKWGIQFLSYIDQVAIPGGLDGAFAFVWDWVDSNSIVSSTPGRLTAWGDAVKSELLDPSATGGSTP